MRGTVTSSPAIFIIIIIIVVLHFGSRTKAARRERPVREIATDILTYKVSLVHNTDDDESALVDPPNVRSVTLK